MPRTGQTPLTDPGTNGLLRRVDVELAALGLELGRFRRHAGLALGRAFFGESMVSRRKDASKVALAWLVARLRAGGFELLDCQFQTPHLASLGVVEIDRADYCALLAGAIDGVVGKSAASPPSSAGAEGDFLALDRLTPSPPLPSDVVSGPVSGHDIVQLLVQTS